MQIHTNTPRESVQHLFDEQLDALKSGVHKLIDRATKKPNWFGRVMNTTGEAIKAHPIATIGIAIGLGYVVVRFARE